MMVLTLTPAVTDVSPGFSVGVGGFGYGSRGGGVGVGVIAPLGGGRVTMGYAANGRVTDVGSGRLVWSASASTAPSSELGAAARRAVEDGVRRGRQVRPVLIRRRALRHLRPSSYPIISSARSSSDRGNLKSSVAVRRLRSAGITVVCSIGKSRR